MQRAEQEQLPTVSTPATAMRYRDVAAAANWLCTAFGFEKQTVLTDDAGRTLYAQLTFGRALLMLAPVGDSPIERFMKQPDEIGGAETQSTYIAVVDADAHHAGRRRPARRSSCPWRTTISAGVATPAVTPRATSGRSGPTTRGRARSRCPCRRPRRRLPPASGGRRAVLGRPHRRGACRGGLAAWLGGALTQLGAVSSTGAGHVRRSGGGPYRGAGRRRAGRARGRRAVGTRACGQGCR